jgi:hypothetical protein
VATASRTCAGAGVEQEIETTEAALDRSRHGDLRRTPADPQSPPPAARRPTRRPPVLDRPDTRPTQPKAVAQLRSTLKQVFTNGTPGQRKAVIEPTVAEIRFEDDKLIRSSRSRRFSDPFMGLDDCGDEERMRLSAALPRRGAALGYVYDMGDWWEHCIVLEDGLEPDVTATYPVCVAGRGDARSRTGIRMMVRRRRRSTWNPSTAGSPARPVCRADQPMLIPVRGAEHRDHPDDHRVHDLPAADPERPHRRRSEVGPPTIKTRMAR